MGSNYEMQRLGNSTEFWPKILEQVAGATPSIKRPPLSHAQMKFLWAIRGTPEKAALKSSVDQGLHLKEVVFHY